MNRPPPPHFPSLPLVHRLAADQVNDAVDAGDEGRARGAYGRGARGRRAGAPGMGGWDGREKWRGTVRLSRSTRRSIYDLNGFSFKLDVKLKRLGVESGHPARMLKPVSRINLHNLNTNWLSKVRLIDNTKWSLPPKKQRIYSVLQSGPTLNNCHCNSDDNNFNYAWRS